MVMTANINYYDIHLDRKKPELLFSQLSNELKRLILNHRDISHEHIISARKLAQTLDINRQTVQMAYDLLEKEKIIEHSSPRCYRIATTSITRKKNPPSTIGIILPFNLSYIVKSNQQVALQYIAGVTDAAAEYKMSTMMLFLPDADASDEIIQQYIDDIDEKLLGIVHIGDRDRQVDNPLEKLVKHSQIPQVIISARSSYPSIGSVLCDTAYIARSLAGQLKAFNHRKIGIISCKDNYSHVFFTYDSYERTSVIKNTLDEYGLYCKKCYSIDCNHKQEIINDELKKMKENNSLPSIFICQNDLLALWAIEALKSLDLSVPDDISVIGYDGIDGIGKVGLTTICQPFYLIGIQAVKMLIEYAENGISDQNRIKYVQPYLASQLTLSRARHESF